MKRRRSLNIGTWKNSDLRNFMSLAGSRSRLAAVSKELGLHWQQTKSYWRDEKAQEFEHRYMEELRSEKFHEFSGKQKQIGGGVQGARSPLATNQKLLAR